MTFCPVMPGFWGFCSFFLKRETAEVGSGKGSWAMGRRFVRICPVFRIFGGDGRVEGRDGVSALAPVRGLADGLGGWLGLSASFFVVLVF